MRWGDPVPRVTANPRRVVVDLLSGLSLPGSVGAELGPEINNTNAPSRLPYLGVGIDGKGPGDIIAPWYVRIQVFDKNPNPVDELSARLESLLTQGGVVLPEGVESIAPVGWYPASKDDRTGLMVGSLTVCVRARYSEPAI